MEWELEKASSHQFCEAAQIPEIIERKEIILGKAHGKCEPDSYTCMVWCGDSKPKYDTSESSEGSVVLTQIGMIFLIVAVI